jgi:hypothetical protein
LFIKNQNYADELCRLRLNHEPGHLVPNVLAPSFIQLVEFEGRQPLFDLCHDHYKSPEKISIQKFEVETNI